jgi:hypothetical protein
MCSRIVYEYALILPALARLASRCSRPPLRCGLESCLCACVAVWAQAFGGAFGRLVMCTVRAPERSNPYVP